MEADSESDFPDAIECPLCGELHEYDVAETEVEFLPTPAMLQAVNAKE